MTSLCNIIMLNLEEAFARPPTAPDGAPAVEEVADLVEPEAK